MTNAGENINLLAKKAVEKNGGSVIIKKKYRSRKGENIMPVAIKLLLDQYIEILQKIYGKHLKTVILYGSYARGDYKAAEILLAAKESGVESMDLRFVIEK